MLKTLELAALLFLLAVVATALGLALAAFAGLPLAWSPAVGAGVLTTLVALAAKS